MLQYFKEFFSVLKNFLNKSSVNRFIRHNYVAFKIFQKNSKSVVLMEFHSMHSSHIAYSYQAHIFSKMLGAKIVAYHQYFNNNNLTKIFKYIKRTFGVGLYGVYKSFGVVTFFEIKPSRIQNIRAKMLFSNVYKSIRTKRDIENISIDGILIGDLIYDTFLMKFKKPTIDHSSQEFQSFLLESFAVFVFWIEYFVQNDVCAINVTHCGYTLAFPLRIAVQRKIPAFQVNATHVYRLSTQNLFAYTDFHYYPKQFSTLPSEIRREGLAEADERIQKRLSGAVGVDMAYSSKSAYGSVKDKRLIKESSRKKILIATHCFFDSPHGYGYNLFPDFYEWLDFLGHITLETDYDWYIKTHPDYLPGTMEIIQDFVRKYPKFILLPSDASHHQIIKEGLDVALTVYGTIGFEYASLGVPVINASVNNPHIAYDFNIHPKTVQEYKEILLNLDKLHFEPDYSQVKEYYYMKNIYNTNNWLFTDYETMLEYVGGYKNQFTPKVYDYWLREWSSEKHESVCATLRKFIESGAFRLNHTHIISACKLLPEHK